MKLASALVIVISSWSAACVATTARPRGATDVVADSAGVAERSDRCRDLAVLASIEVYPIGLNPQRRFEAVGTVETGLEGSPMQRVSTLQAKACELGADAVIGWSEEGLGAGLATAFDEGTTILSIDNGRPVSASGIAVVYTDRDESAGDADETASLWDPTL